jgi:serine/threonine protein kinase
MNAFQMLMGVKHAVLEFVVEPPKQNGMPASLSPTKTISPVAAKRTKGPLRAKIDIPMEQLTSIGLLGKGSFGTVTLVRDSKSGETYALKALSIEHVVRTKQQKHTLNEKIALENLDHPFIIKQYNTYRDHTNLFMLLEPALGGELFTLLRYDSCPPPSLLLLFLLLFAYSPLPLYRTRSIISSDESLFYAACTLLVFEHMHGEGYVYRDLKPENMLLVCPLTTPLTLLILLTLITLRNLLTLITLMQA